MTFRITDPSQLEHVSPSIRKQIEQHLDAGAAGPASRRRRPEQEAGALLIQWIDLYYIQHPLLGRVCVGDYFMHTPNGGARSAVEAAILHGQGVRKGWPDYSLYLPSRQWHGAVLELKATNGAKPDDEQLEILIRLEKAGYKPIVAWGFDEARAGVEAYFEQ